MRARDHLLDWQGVTHQQATFLKFYLPHKHVLEIKISEMWKFGRAVV